MVDLISERGWVRPSLQALPHNTLAECFQRAMATGRKAFTGLLLQLRGGQEEDPKAGIDSPGLNKVSNMDGRHNLSQSSKQSPGEHLRKEIQAMIDTSHQV